MFAVIFEVNPIPEQWDAYLAYAESLRPELERTDGFIDNERFASLRRKGWVLSLSIWRDEKAVVRWRTSPRHHATQARGRAEVFRDYHLRVGEIITDNQLPAGQSLQEQRFDPTAAAAKFVALFETVPTGLSRQADATTVAARLGGSDMTAHNGLTAWDAFESITQPGKSLLLTSWRDAAEAEGFPGQGSGVRHRRVRVIRDYGMFDRAEAPQYFPPAPAAQSGTERIASEPSGAL
jgi:heme-degrading monooxygenase HmoA